MDDNDNTVIIDGNELRICSICTGSIPVMVNGWKHGHNADPVAEGRCCTYCNDTKVIPARLQAIEMRLRPRARKVAP